MAKRSDASNTHPSSPTVHTHTHNTRGSEPVERPTQKRHTCIHCAKYARGRWIRNKIIFATLDDVVCAPETCVSSVPFFFLSHARSHSRRLGAAALCTRVAYIPYPFLCESLIHYACALWIFISNHQQSQYTLPHSRICGGVIRLFGYAGSQQYASIHIFRGKKGPSN